MGLKPRGMGASSHHSDRGEAERVAGAAGPTAPAGLEPKARDRRPREGRGGRAGAVKGPQDRTRVAPRRFARQPPHACSELLGPAAANFQR